MSDIERPPPSLKLPLLLWLMIGMACGVSVLWLSGEPVERSVNLALAVVFGAIFGGVAGMSAQMHLLMKAEEERLIDDRNNRSRPQPSPKPPKKP
jgi:hypothetical protein